MKGLEVILLFAAIALISCFMPITEEVVFAVEDSMNPVIVITSPEEGSAYMSEVIIKGHVKDDSLKSGDNKGSLSSLSATASSSLDHRGRIEIDPDGGYQADTDFGRISGSNFTYNPTDKSFIVKIDTTDYSSQIMFISIRAVDRNGNESRKDLELLRSTGPYIVLTSPTKTTYLQGEVILIKGKVTNSKNQEDAYNEIASLRLQIPSLSMDETLDIAGGDDTVFFHSRSSGTALRYVKDDSTFNCSFWLWDTEAAQNLRLTITVSASDKNGNTNSVNKMLMPVTSNPTVNTNFSGYRDYYYSAPPTGGSQLTAPFYSPALASSSQGGGGDEQHYANLVFSGRVKINNPDAKGNEPTIKLIFSSAKQTSGELTSTKTKLSEDLYEFSYSASVGTLNNFVNGGGTVTARLIVEDSEGGTTEKRWIIHEDSTPPVITPSRITTTPNTQSRYVGTSDTVTLQFKVSDTVTGLGSDSLISGTVAGIDLGVITPRKVSDGFLYRKTVSLANATQKQSGNLDISISVKDKLGNIRTVEEDVFPHLTSTSNNRQLVQFISGAPTLDRPDSISIASKRENFTTAALPGDTVILTLRASQQLKLTSLVATIAGVRATVKQPDSNNANEFTAEVVIPSGYTTNPIPFEITAFENIVGTSGANLPIRSTTDSSSVTCLPVLSSVSIDLEKQTGKTGSTPEAGDKVVLSFNVASTPVLNGDPEVTFTLINKNNKNIRSFTVTKDASVTAPAYRYAHTIAADDLSLNGRKVGYTIAFRDSGNNTGSVKSGESTFVLQSWPELSSVSIDLEKQAGNTGSVPEIRDKVVLSFNVGRNPAGVNPVVTFTLNNRSSTIRKDASAYRYAHTIALGDLRGGKVEYTIAFPDSGSDPVEVKSGESTFVLWPALSSVSIDLEKQAGKTGSTPEAGDKVVLSFNVASTSALNGDPVVTFTLNNRSSTITKDTSVTTPAYRYAHTIVDNDLSGEKVGYTIAFRDSERNPVVVKSGESTFVLPLWPALSSVSIDLEKQAGKTGSTPEAGDKVVLSFNVASTPALNGDPVVTFTLNNTSSTITRDASATTPAYRYAHTIVADNLSGEKVGYTIAFLDSGNKPVEVKSGESTFVLPLASP